MAASLHLVAGKATDSVTHGFLPAAARLGLDVTLLTDRPAAAHGFDGPVAECDVSDFREIIAAVEAGPAFEDGPAAVFSNSDFLQAPAALAAGYFGLPAKDWRAATRAKNKGLMRRHLAPVDPVFSADARRVPEEAPYPLVVKPREGVASEDVFLVQDAAELAARVKEIAVRRDDPLVAEQYLPGRLHTLETLGDGREIRVLGSFLTTVSPPPFFVEERLEWVEPPPETPQVLRQLEALGIGFGACHTEFVVHEGRAHIIEVNYRLIGDHCDFLLADLLGVPLFEQILKVHLGEPLADWQVPGPRHAVAEPVIADRSGKLTAAPGPLQMEDGPVRLAYRPQREVGDTVTVTRTNRDYLGTVRAIGPSADQVDAALARFRAAHDWTIA
ncbi:ATP-grasp domain-containing protein [Actinomadura livida]|uniref:Biotin carboxylase n=1 Tax=Actinomadura livida TaxID=79909 RepID=A0A7W7IIF4_9ACTN|nr:MULTISPECIES: ATP-grasp domain-containing protein [Actinomadura]MBB4777288.1 biotin carboxylase [Actinomadura catellatispora]GGU20320.1 carboxylate--amine ligase [Actinomadura livida]